MTTLVLVSCIAIALDAQNALAWIRRFLLRPGAATSTDYTLLVPVYGHRRYFENRDHLAPHRERTLVVLDMAGVGMSSLAAELEDEGWCVHRTRLPVPGPPQLILDALTSGAVETTYAFRLDADTRPLDDPGPFVARMAEERVDYVSVRVHVSRPQRIVEKIQALEYRMAMRSRRLRPWLSSGACFGGTTTAMTRIFDLHSRWFPGEDLESGRIALALRYRVRHLDLRVETDAPATWRGLYRQRRSWWAGGFRHAVLNADKNLVHTPIWFLYNTGLVVAAWAFKVSPYAPPMDAVSVLLGLATLMALYTLLTLVVNWSERSPWILVYAPYALFQVLAMPSLGAFYWARRALEQRHWGRYRFGYRRGSELRERSGHVLVDASQAPAPAAPRPVLGGPATAMWTAATPHLSTVEGLTVREALETLAGVRRRRPWLVPAFSPSR